MSIQDDPKTFTCPKRPAMILLILFLFVLDGIHPVIAAESKKIHPYTVVIDPGHGGKDSGAMGPSGSLEKDIVLAIARKLQSFIQHEPSMRVLMTRADDRFLSLAQRARIAQEARADLFISLHADAYEDGEARGSSVFVLSDSGASSEAARCLADRENAGEVGGVALDREDALVASVLVDLSKNATREASEKAAIALMQSLTKGFKIHSPTVQKAEFRVLKSLDVPSMLIETGFISSIEEEKRLQDPRHQERLAKAIFNGIQRLNSGK